LLKNVTAIVISYKIIENVLETSLKHFRKYYPDMQLIIIDGSSFDDSSKWVYDFAKKDKKTRVLFNDFNLHHGPGMDAGIRLTRTPYSFLFDSDSNIIKEGLIEKMLNVASLNQNFYSIGTLHNVNEYGVDVMSPYESSDIQRVDKIKDRQKGICYIHPRAKLIQIKQYFQFYPFIKHGAPCGGAYMSIQKANKQNLLFHFPVTEYIDHPTSTGGTVRHTGFNLYTKEELEIMQAKKDKEDNVLKVI